VRILGETEKAAYRGLVHATFHIAEPNSYELFSVRDAYVETGRLRLSEFQVYLESDNCIDGFKQGSLHFFDIVLHFPVFTEISHVKASCMTDSRVNTSPDAY
jgi:hypothetical protein